MQNKNLLIVFLSTKKYQYYKLDTDIVMDYFPCWKILNPEKSVK